MITFKLLFADRTKTYELVSTSDSPGASEDLMRRMIDNGAFRNYPDLQVIMIKQNNKCIAQIPISYSDTRVENA